jgi:hypothetical protein
VGGAARCLYPAAMLSARNSRMTHAFKGTNHSMAQETSKQLLHLVFGGELKDLSGSIEFANLRNLDIVGIYPNYREAYAAWRGASQKTVDNALMRYFIVHLHRLLDPEDDAGA